MHFVEGRVVERLVQQGDELSVYGQPSVGLEEMLEMSVFEPFRPGMDFDVAESLAVPDGPPAQSEERPVDQIQSYSTDKGKLEVIHQKIESEGDERVFWRLRFVPNAGQPRDYLTGEVLEVIPSYLSSYRLTLLEEDNCGAMALAEIENGRVEVIYWLCERCC